MTSHSKCYLYVPNFGVQEFTYTDDGSDIIKLTKPSGKTSNKGRKKFESDYGLFPEQAIIKHYFKQKCFSKDIIRKALKRAKDEEKHLEKLYTDYNIDDMKAKFPEEFI